MGNYNDAHLYLLDPNNPSRWIPAEWPLRVAQSGNWGVELTAPAEIAGYRNLKDGSKDVTTAGTAVQLSSSSVSCKKVVVQAKNSNSKSIMVGSSTVKALGEVRGIRLYSSGTFELMVNNLTDVWIDAEVSGEGCTFIYYV